MKKSHTTVYIENFTPKNIPSSSKRIHSWAGIFYRAVETSGFVFFCNYQEGDDNSNTIMFRKVDMTLISDNYFASAELFEILSERVDEILYLSPTAKQILRCINR